MFSRIRNFISRHRRKFFGVAVTGAVIWGGWNYFAWRLRRSEEEYVSEVLKKAKRHMHHKSSAQAAERQAMALTPVAVKTTMNVLDCAAIVSQLKGIPKDTSKSCGKMGSSVGEKYVPKSLTSEERVSKWSELKRVTVARAVAYAYVPSILIVFLRLQLGLLGGYVFKSCGGDDIAAFLDGTDESLSKEEKKENLPVEIQEAYLSLTQFYLEGKSDVLNVRDISQFREPHDDIFGVLDRSSCNAKGKNVKGKSQLNLVQPAVDLNGTVGGCLSLRGLPQKRDGLTSSSELPGEPKRSSEKSYANKNGSNISEGTSSNGNEASKVVVGNMNVPTECGTSVARPVCEKNEQLSSQARVSDEKKEGPSSVCKPDGLHIEDKNVAIGNGFSGGSNSSDHGSTSCESSLCGVGDIDQKCLNGQDIVEEDSGRCSGADDMSEDEQMEVKQSESGIGILCSIIEKKVGRVVDGVGLTAPFSLAETETLFWGILTSIRSNPAEDPAFNLPKYLLPPPEKIKGMAEEIELHVDKKAANIFLEMVAETSDLLETKEVVELVQSCVSAGLGHVMDKLANHFPQDSWNGELQSSSSTTKRLNQKQPTIPMAKLIPIITKVAFEKGTPWVTQLLEMGNLKDFGANVYEAFTH